MLCAVLRLLDEWQPTKCVRYTAKFRHNTLYSRYNVSSNHAQRMWQYGNGFGLAVTLHGMKEMKLWNNVQPSRFIYIRNSCWYTINGQCGKVPLYSILMAYSNTPLLLLLSMSFIWQIYIHNMIDIDCDHIKNYGLILVYSYNSIQFPNIVIERRLRHCVTKNIHTLT